MDFPAPNSAPTPSHGDVPRSPRPGREPPYLRTARAAFRRSWQAFSHWIQVHTFAPAWLPAPLRHPLFGCLVGVLLIAIDVWVDFLLREALPGFALRDTLILLTLLFLALVWGIWPSFTLMLVGILLLDYFLLPPPFSFTLSNGAEGLLLLSVGAVLCLVASDRQQARQGRSSSSARPSRRARRWSSGRHPATHPGAVRARTQAAANPVRRAAHGGGAGRCSGTPARDESGHHDALGHGTALR